MRTAFSPKFCSMFLPQVFTYGNLITTSAFDTGIASNVLQHPTSIQDGRPDSKGQPTLAKTAKLMTGSNVDNNP